MDSRTSLRTYSKRKQQISTHDTLKRRRVTVLEDTKSDRGLESAPSSDVPSSDTAVFSDENIPPSTPPSSPPSFNVTPIAKPVKCDVTQKSIEEQVPAVSASKTGKRLVQMQLNFGQAVRRACRDCGMEYVPSVPEDAALHKKYHIRHTTGLVMDKEFLKRAEQTRALWRGRPGAFIISIDGSRDPKSLLKKARAIFDIATSDLGAVDISDEKLWGISRSKPVDRRETVGGSPEESQAVKYKLYLYMDGSKCVGLCLAEHISRAYEVIEQEGTQNDNDTADTSQSQRPRDALLQISDETTEARVGISRIWTSRGARKRGIATALLDCVAATFQTGIATSKSMIAFSQPTEMGTGLARRWFGGRSGWHVYTD